LTPTAESVREATVADLGPLVEMLHSQRREYERHSPIFWRVAADDRELHRPFLELMITLPDVVSLVTSDMSGCLFAFRRPDGWLVDDFSVAEAARWAEVGPSLLAAAIERIGEPVTVVCGARDESKRTALMSTGLNLFEQWWVGPTRDDGEDLVDVGSFRLVDAPPVYDPGGPAAMVSAWDGTTGALAALASAAGSAGAAVLVVPVAGLDAGRQSVLTDAGFSPASEWFVSA
jgi:hypothetical protein